MTGQSAPPGAPLGTRRISAEDGARRAQSRRRRYSASGWLHRASSLERVRECGNLVRDWWEVKKTPEGVAHHAGLRSCGSPWSCPVCAVKIAAGRVEEIAAALTAARADGWTILFLTGTFSHHRGQALAPLLDAQQAAWRHLTKSWLWRGMDVEYVRIREHTWGEASGWHPHYHAALLVRGPVDRAALEAALSVEWRRSLVKVGLSGTVAHALRLDEWSDDQADGDLAGYLVKQLALEVAGGPMKLGREGRHAPFGILEAATDGEVWAVERWREHEQATAGKRTVFWSQGMRKYRPEAEKSDQELADSEVGGVLVLAANGPVKRAVFADTPRGVFVLELAEEDPRLALAYVKRLAPPGGQIIEGEAIQWEGGDFVGQVRSV